MARVQYGSLVTGVSGSIGSATFQKSLYGNTLRNKPRPRRSSTVSQQTARLIMTVIHKAWTALSAAQRNQWNQFISYSSASINRDKKVLLTGHSLFIKYNFLRYLTLHNILTDPTYIPMPIWPSFVKMEYGSQNEFNISLTSDMSIFDLNWVFKMSAPRPSTLSFTKQGVRYIHNPWTGDEFIECSQAIKNVFGVVPVTGSWIHYEIIFFSTLAPIYSSVTKGVCQVIVLV
jgi:hypothetical protein